MILNASLLAKGWPLRGSRYLAGAPVTAHTSDIGPFVFEKPVTTETLPAGVST